MTLEETRALLIPLALALRAEFDPPTQRAYHRVLKDVPVNLGQAAVAELQRAGLRFLPTAPEIQTAAEKARRQLLALHPYEGCVDCEDQRGYRTVLGVDGQKTVARCPCKARWQARLESMGALASIADLPGEGGAGDEAVYPTAEQLPPALADQVRQIAGTKQMR